MGSFAVDAVVDARHHLERSQRLRSFRSRPCHILSLICRSAPNNRCLSWFKDEVSTVGNGKGKGRREGEE